MVGLSSGPNWPKTDDKAQGECLDGARQSIEEAAAHLTLAAILILKANELFAWEIGQPEHGEKAAKNIVKELAKTIGELHIIVEAFKQNGMGV